MLLHKFCKVSPLIVRSATNFPSSLTARRALSGCQTVRSATVLGTWCQKGNQDSLINRHGVSKDSPLYNVQSIRLYNKKKTIKIPPTKALTFDYSGDLVTILPPIDPAAPKPGFEEVEELKTAEQNIKDIFSMKFADGPQVRQKRLNEILSQIQEHPADLQSLEVKIARSTLLLRNQMQHVLAFRKDKVGKVLLIKRIQRRNRNLRTLRTLDMEKFEWLLDELKIKFIPKKEWYEKRLLSKRAARKQAARESFFAVKKDKLHALRTRLQKERVDFQKEKEEQLTKIAKELEAMGITEVDSVDSVLQAIGMEEYIEKPERLLKRRYLILERKFALHEEREKAKKHQQEANL